MSNAGEAKKRRNPEGEGALGCLAALLTPHRLSRTCSSLGPCHPAQSALARRGWVFQQAPKMQHRVLFCLANVALALKVAAQSAVDVTRPEERQKARQAIVKQQEKRAQRASIIEFRGQQTFGEKELRSALKEEITTIDDFANRLSHGINLTRAQMAFTLLDTVVPIAGMEPVGELRMVPDPETFTPLPWMPSHASMCCDLVDKDGGRYGACTRSYLKDVLARVAERGLRIQAAFEPEFYLGKRNAQTGR